MFTHSVCFFGDLSSSILLLSFFFNDPATTEIYTLSLHDALPICGIRRARAPARPPRAAAPLRRAAAARPSATVPAARRLRSEEHTSELQSQFHLVCRLLLEKKKKKKNTSKNHITHKTQHTNSPDE